MKIILDKPATETRSKKRRVTVELDEGENFIFVSPDSFYKLGYPMDDQVIASHILDGLEKVVWDSLEQKWL
jgi:hypothetical protein